METHTSNAEQLYEETLRLTKAGRIIEAKPFAEQALKAAIREHGAVTGDIDWLTKKCRLAVMRCGGKPDEMDLLIQRERESLVPSS